jgi:hypothetical protein
MIFNGNKNAKNEEIKNYIPVSQSLPFDKVKPFIETAQRDYLLPIMGAAAIAALEAYYSSPDETDENKRAIYQGLLVRSQRAVINIAFLLGFDALNSEIDGSGFGRLESEHRKGMYKYQEDNLRDWFKTTGFNSFDDVLQYLHANISTFNEYAASEPYKRFKSQFFKSVQQFDDIYPIGNSYLTFLRLLKHMQVIIDFDLQKTIGPELLLTITEEISKTELTTATIKLLPYLQKPLAYLSSAKLMEDTGADLTENGLYFTAWSSGGQNQLKKEPATEQRVVNLVTRNREIGKNYLSALCLYLDKSADWEFTLSRGTAFSRNNTNKKTFWA